MKRVGNLYEKVFATENILRADKEARKGKAKSYGVRLHDKNKASNLKKLQQSFQNQTYKTSRYTTFTIQKPKERLIYRLPYYPDRIAHHAIMNVIEPILHPVFTANTYACIKGRGIHAAVKKIKADLKDVSGTKYCLKIDIRKFYPSVNHDILIGLLKRKIKDKKLLALLSEIIRSAPGLPIGNYLSQTFANFYLAFFDHWVKEVLRAKYYYRYADDIVILSASKEVLHDYFKKIKIYLAEKLKLEIKGNYQVFPIEKRGLDFVGYVFYHTHTRLRKQIKKSFARAAAAGKGKEVLCSYYGWATHCNSKNLIKKLINESEPNTYAAAAC